MRSSRVWRYWRASVSLSDIFGLSLTGTGQPNKWDCLSGTERNRRGQDSIQSDRFGFVWPPRPKARMCTDKRENKRWSVGGNETAAVIAAGDLSASSQGAIAHCGEAIQVGRGNRRGCGQHRHATSRRVEPHEADNPSSIDGRVQMRAVTGNK